jgi:hypothetical protein
MSWRLSPKNLLQIGKASIRAAAILFSSAITPRLVSFLLLAVRATLWRMGIEILLEIHRYRFAKRGGRFGSDVELMIVYGAAIAHTP